MNLRSYIILYLVIIFFVNYSSLYAQDSSEPDTGMPTPQVAGIISMLGGTSMATAGSIFLFKAIAKEENPFEQKQGCTRKNMIISSSIFTFCGVVWAIVGIGLTAAS